MENLSFDSAEDLRDYISLKYTKEIVKEDMIKNINREVSHVDKLKEFFNLHYLIGVYEGWITPEENPLTKSGKDGIINIEG